MQRCNRCKMDIQGYKKSCPLCGGALTGEGEEPAYPTIKRKIMTRALVVRVSAFVTIAFIVIMMLLNSATNGKIEWIPLAVISSLVCFADICLTVYFRSNPIKTVTWQMIVGMILSVLVDYYTGWHGWSVIWVLPCVFVVMLITTLSIGFGLRMSLRDFVLYLLLETLLSLIQIPLIKTGINRFPMPAMWGEAAVILFFVGIVLFRWRDFKSASDRYFNI